jgi:hypothetical protein
MNGLFVLKVNQPDPSERGPRDDEKSLEESLQTPPSSGLLFSASRNKKHQLNQCYF